MNPSTKHFFELDESERKYLEFLKKLSNFLSTEQLANKNEYFKNELMQTINEEEFKTIEEPAQSLLNLGLANGSFPELIYRLVDKALESIKIEEYSCKQRNKYNECKTQSQALKSFHKQFDKALTKIKNTEDGINMLEIENSSIPEHDLYSMKKILGCHNQQYNNSVFGKYSSLMKINENIMELDRSIENITIDLSQFTLPPDKGEGKKYVMQAKAKLGEVNKELSKKLGQTY